jgi:cytochrome c5
MNDPMQRRSVSVTFIAIAACAVVLALTAACAPATGNGPQLNTPGAEQSVQVDPAGEQADAVAGIPAKIESTETQAGALPDGQSLLETRCAQCHLVQSLEQNQKSRLDWEKSLKQMEMMGVRLDDTEKGILLDYLAAAGKD